MHAFLAPVPHALVRNPLRAWRWTGVAAALTLTTMLVACQRAEAPPDVVRAVKVMTVGATTGTRSLDYAGVIAARTESRLGFRVAGKLTERAVNLGEHVKAGQVLARLDAQDYRLAADAARAQVAAATTQRDLAQADVARYRALRDKNFISAAEMDRREAQLKGTQAQLDQARAQLASQSNQAGYTQLVADAAGVVTGVEAEVGQVVAAGAPVIRLARDGERDAVFAVPEDQVPAFRVGTPMTVRSWAGGGSQPGVVREVAASADAASRTFAVKVALTAPAGEAPALGSTVYASLDAAAAAAAAPAAIRVPTSAIREHHGKTQVWVLDPQSLQVKARDVRSAGVDGNDVVIGQGLQPGEQVVVAGVHVLNDGQKVKVYTPKSEQGKTAAATTASSRQGGATGDPATDAASGAATLPASASASVPGAAAR
ncbi:efflux transporter periplasmic adaptor subunit [Comamonas serinivorans]|uniref:Efflux transporter periplasmic adaptor subunit n=1 Tax=Comamonas serinivorans TaxID=1082851 RepID=A0A1Y0EJS6_9BURK|nr:efflux transporter periplasmic adaptor subunit [Comamonas serinivorans]